MFYFILFYFILFYFILFYFILFLSMHYIFIYKFDKLVKFVCYLYLLGFIVQNDQYYM